MVVGGLVYLLMFSLFIVEMIRKEQQFLKEQSLDQAKRLSEILAINSGQYIIGNDFDGLERLIQSHSNFSSLRFAMVLDNENLVLAHTNEDLIGTMLVDSVSRQKRTTGSSQILVANNSMVDLMTPVFNGEKVTIGWVRVNLDRTAVTNNIRMLARKGAAYILIASLLGAIVVFLFAKRLMSGVNELIEVTNQYKSGDKSIRADNIHSHEINRLGEAINSLFGQIAYDEELIGKVLTHMPLGVWVLDQSGKIVTVNPEGKKLLPYSIENSELVRNFLVKRVNDGIEMPESEWAGLVAIKTGRPVLGEELEFEYADGSKKILLNSGIPLVNEQNEIKGAIAISVDVSKLKETAAELQKANWMMGERVKELNGLFKISEIANNPHFELKEILELSADALKQAYQFPEHCQVQLSLGGELFATPGFQKSQWLQEENILLGKAAVGSIAVCYDKEMPAADIGPFLKEEALLLDSAAKILANAFSRRNAIAGLEDSEQRFRRLIDHLGIGIVVLDRHLNLKMINNSAQQLMGVTESDLLDLPAKNHGIKWYREDGSVFPPEEYPVAICQRSLKTVPPTLMLMRRKLDEQMVWLMISAVPNFNKEGELIEVTSTLTDVTAAREAEERIKQLSRLYRFISEINSLIVRAETVEEIYEGACNIAIEHGEFEMAWVGAVAEGTNAVVPFISAGNVNGYLDNFKISLDPNDPTSLGPTGRAFRNKTYYYCNDMATNPDMKPWREKALARNFKSSISIPIIIKNEILSCYTLYMSKPNFFNNEELILLQEVVQNLAFGIEKLKGNELRIKMQQELKDSEEKFRKIIQSAANPILIVDSQMKITLMNPEVERVFGYCTEELMGKEINLLIPERFREKHADYQSDYLQNARAIKMGHDRFISAKRKDGSELFIEASLNTMEISGAVYVLIIIQDVTQRIEADRQIRDQFEKLKHIAWQQSHEVRKPLANVMGLVGLLKGDKNRAHDQEILSALFDSAAEMDRIVRSITDVTQEGD